MAELDRLREESRRAKESLRSYATNSPATTPPEYTEWLVRAAEEAATAAVLEWISQGCREVDGG